MDRPAPVQNLRFHSRTGFACVVFLAFAAVGSRLTSIVMVGGGSLLLILAVCLAIVSPLPAYWHEKHRPDRREAVLAPLWMLPFGFTLPFVVNVCGRSAMPLQDLHFAHLDQLMGINVPLIALWASQHRLGSLINSTYPMLIYYFVPLAVIAPGLFGRWVAAREFLAANVVSLIIGLTAFTLLPAIGPWYGYHLPPDPAQHFCQTELLLLRGPGSLVTHPAGIVCFPSFHVIWAILCARTLWTFRLFRIPTAIFTGMVILSTLTTGWHYFTDVLGGAVVAYASIYIAGKLICDRPSTRHRVHSLRVAVPAIATRNL